MQGVTAHIDFETGSACDLKKSGVFRYAEDPTTRVWGFAFWFTKTGTDEVVIPMQQWRPGYADPMELLVHVSRGDTVGCHNASFERTMWNEVLRGRDYAHWPEMRIEQQDCTMSRAASVALPQPLDKLGIALGTSMQKDMEGHKLMMKMAKPRKYHADGTIEWWDAPELVDRNLTYCEQDVRVETAADVMLPQLSPSEREVWEFDQVINERGVCIDAHAVERAAQLVEYSKKQLDRVIRDLTNRNVKKTSADKQIIAWLNARGVECTSLAKGEIEDVVFLASCHLDELAEQVIRLRQAGWKTSTAKYRAMQACVSWDDRGRGWLNYHAASTGRWGGRLVQPQNFPRMQGATDEETLLLQREIAYLHELLNSTRSIRDIYDIIEAIYGPLKIMDLLSKALRSMLIAAEGHKLVGGDFSNIEGRVNSWLAGETWKLQAFKDFDTIVGYDDKGKAQRAGPDLYALAYARSFGVDIETVGKGQKRQIGKVQELGLGFQGSIAAYLTMGATYGVNPFSLSQPVYEATSAQQWDETALLYHKRGTNRYGLFEKEWTALKILVDNWRAANPAVVQSWWDYQDAAIEAVSAPGTVISVVGGRVEYYSDGGCLWCVLPSGNMLCYHNPEVVQELYEYVTATGEVKTRVRNKVTFWGTDSVTKQWRKQSLYGGLQCENIVQATARDLMVYSMLNVERAGYPIILTVHDEIVSEVEDWMTDMDDKRFAEVMSRMPDWANGLPVSVGAWEDKRYVK